MHSSDHRAVLDAIRAIPRGRVASYGAIARRAGLPGRARLVGWVLRHAGDDAALPWHRVLRSDGRIAFPEGSSAHAEQCRRLAREGVVAVRGRVPLRSFGLDAALDAAIWGPPPLKRPARGGTTPRR